MCNLNKLSVLTPTCAALNMINSRLENGSQQNGNIVIQKFRNTLIQLYSNTVTI